MFYIKHTTQYILVSYKILHHEQVIDRITAGSRANGATIELPLRNLN